jgi:lon-related putative ATP-dependent protease
MSDNNIKIKEISWEEASFSVNSVPSNIPELQEGYIIGQPRAMRALEMGLNVERWGYNVFVSGDSGTGKLSAIKAVAEKKSKDLSNVLDIAYLHNFRNSDNPKVLVLNRGNAIQYKKLIDTFVSDLKTKIKSNEKINTDELFLKLDEIDKHFNDINISSHLNVIKKDIIHNCDDLSDDILNRYGVNVLIDHQYTKERPFIVENNPSFTTLFGGVNTDKDSSLLPYQRIKAGSILEASGGILILFAEEMLHEDGLWEALKRYLDSNKLTLKDSSFSSKGILKERNIRADIPHLPIKIVLIGTEDIYSILSEKDDQFLKHFKVSAQFDYSMERNEENVGLTLSYLNKFIKENNLFDLTEDGKKRIIRHSSWFCEHRNELTTQFSQLTDLLVECNWWAHHLNKTVIDREVIDKTVRERDYASSLIESKITQEIERGEMLISLQGSKVGVVNGLAVMDRGVTSFGIPTVITAAVAPGSEGIVNIEHEAGLSGEIHDKGLLILEGYLRKHYARTFPLSIYAGIAFEQSYAEVDGDSASSSELYALLSAIAEIPIRQEIAVTGSVNQLGVIQPVGGINDKIQGFYKACNHLGLTGRQGVIIPIQNVKNLILEPEVEKAIKEGKFHIYPISQIDEGMQILTGRSIGERGKKGNFPIGTFNREVDDNLKELFKMIANPSR